MFKVQIEDMDINKISMSGQCFRMNRLEGEDEVYSLVAFGDYLEMRKEEGGYIFSCCEREWEERWKEYFDCETNYGKIYSLVDEKDVYMRSAVAFGKGIRILRQELYETIICFIISQQNNIPRIKKCVETICSRYGEEKINYRGKRYYAFPTPWQMAALTEEELRSCNLGYRSRYIRETAKVIAKGEVDMETLIHMDYESAKKELMKLRGVGVKVAECICLFALHHADAFPVDTHIQTVLKEYYPLGFPFEKYKGYAGILQQYAFYYDIYNK